MYLHQNFFIYYKDEKDKIGRIQTSFAYTETASVLMSCDRTVKPLTSTKMEMNRNCDEVLQL